MTIEEIKQEIEDRTGRTVNIDEVIDDKNAIISFSTNNENIKGRMNISTDCNIDRIIEVINNDDSENISNFIHLFTDFDAIKDNLRLCVRKHADDNIITRRFLDLDMYARIVLDDKYSAKFTKKLGESLCVDDDVIIDTAINNTNFKIVDMCDIIPFAEKGFMIIGTSDDHSYGASSICCNKILEDMRTALDSDFIYVIPSSVHEIIAIDGHTKADVEMIRNMVSEVNSTAVDEKSFLSNNVYTFDGTELKIVA